MRMARCGTCRKKVSISASACPKCGGTYFKKKSRVGVFVFLAAIAVIVIAVASNNNSNQTANENGVEVFVQEPEETGGQEYQPVAQPILTGAELIYYAVDGMALEQAHSIVELLASLGIGEIIQARDTTLPNIERYRFINLHDEITYSLTEILGGGGFVALEYIHITLDVNTFAVLDVDYRLNSLYMDGDSMMTLQEAIMAAFEEQEFWEAIEAMTDEEFAEYLQGLAE